MPHGSQIQQDSTKLNPHGSSVTNVNKFTKSNEYDTINSDQTTVQLNTELAGSNLETLANEQLSKNVLWKPTNEYDLFTMEQQSPPILKDVVSQIGLGSLVNFENTVLGRFLGVGPKTPMIQIANSRLVLEFTRRVAGQLTKNLLPTINLGGFIAGKIGLGPKEPLIRPAQEFIITKLPSGERDTEYYVNLFTGFESNKNPLEDIYGQKSFVTPEELIKRTGSGQISLLKQNIEQNIYSPQGIEGFGVGGFLTKVIGKINKWLFPNKNETSDTQTTLPHSYDPVNYVPTDVTGKHVVINDPKYKGIGNALSPQQRLEDSLGFPTEKQVDNFFKQNLKDSLQQSSDDLRGWEQGRGEELAGTGWRGLLKFTQDIVDSGHAVGKRISHKFGHGEMELDDKQETKGRKLLKLKDGKVVITRSWIKTDQYDSYKKAIRSSNHYLIREGNLSNLKTNSVLNNIGIPRIHPVGPFNGINKDKKIDVNMKPMMFSIENLAWDIDDLQSLPLCEIGPNKGRIMWFPPYDIGLDENINASWERTDFIARGEPVYTYNNSERTLNFQFKLIVDYPSNLRSNIDSNRNDADTFFAGSDEPSKTQARPLSQEDINKLDVKKEEISKSLEQPETNIELEKYTGPGKSESDSIKFYFDHSDKESQDTFDSSYNGIPSLDLNKNIENDASDLVTFLNNSSDAKNYDLKLEGHTSKVGSDDFNNKLAKSRINAVKKFLEERGDTFKEYSKTKQDDSNINTIIESNLGKGGDELKENKNTENQIKERFVKVWLEINPNVDPEELNQTEKKLLIDKLDNIEKQLNEQRAGNFIGGECLYFKELKENDPFVFNSYKQKIDYFHPGFHSQTPEDFNKRLTFLHQCTRQGKPFTTSSNGKDEDLPKNSVFGRMPVCVLRIGDFFNCRIIINNIGFSYDPLIWDLNPEGSGVQPMLCNVNINCNIIGGASLKEPITQLQNAISSKFYANHQENSFELAEWRIDKELETNPTSTRDTLISELIERGTIKRTTDNRFIAI